MSILFGWTQMAILLRWVVVVEQLSRVLLETILGQLVR